MMRVLLAAMLGSLVAAVAPASGQERLFHGADSVFATRDAVIVWGVLRAAVENETQVVIRIVPAARFGAVSVDAVDPFTGVRRPVVAPRPLTGPIDVRRRRADFADLPRLEIHFHREAGANAELTIYYLGVPDTTPEFAVEPALLRYLDESVTEARRDRERR